MIPARFSKISMAGEGSTSLGVIKSCYDKIHGFHTVDDGEPVKGFKKGRETIRLIFEENHSGSDTVGGLEGVRLEAERPVGTPL